jgi:hypothetical protein
MIIVVTVPFYCAGGLLLISAPRRPNSTPTPNVPAGATRPNTTGAPPSPTAIGAALLPTLTPILVLRTTPTQISFAPTPTPITLPGGLGTTNPTAISFFPPTQAGGAPFCSAFNGVRFDNIRADVPAQAAGGGAVYCRQLTDNNAIGVQSVLDRGVILAFDVFALDGSRAVTRFNARVGICLRGSGQIVFLDATLSPRTPADLPTSSDGGFSCAGIPNAGTVVLVSR